MVNRRSKKWIILGGILFLFFLVVVAGLQLVKEPLRRYLEGRMNRSLAGYTITLGGLDLRPVFTINFRNLRISQDAHPDPPVASFPELQASIHWKALLSGRMVGDMLIRNAEFSFDLNKIESESKDKVPLEKRGWPGPGRDVPIQDQRPSS